MGTTGGSSSNNAVREGAAPNADAPGLLRNDQGELCFYYSRTARKPSGLEALLLCGETVTAK